jgi:GDP-L-fucose synthase
MVYPLKNKRIWVAGHKGMVGAALVRRLQAEKCEILSADRQELDLLDQSNVCSWVSDMKPDCVILAAAKVGGISANSEFPVDFLRENLIIQNNVFDAAHMNNVNRLLFLGSSCIYPKFATQPIIENSLLTGQLEPTNEYYAIAKIAGIKLCQAYRRQFGRDWISAMPTNLYGPGDNYDLKNSHVLPALLKKFHEAKSNNTTEVTIWGTGTPLREFMHCDDLADALVFLLKNYSDKDHINIGTGQEISIKKLAELIADVVGCDAELIFDTSKPDGTPRKLIDSSRLSSLGWNNARPLLDGIKHTYLQYPHQS